MHRGVAVWTGRAGRRVFLNTRWRLIALDGATGEPVESFGHRSEIDLTENLLWRTRPTDAPAASTSRSPRPGVAPTRGIDPLSASSSAPVAVPVFSDRIQVVTDHSPQPIGRRSVFRFLDPFATPSGSAKHAGYVRARDAPSPESQSDSVAPVGMLSGGCENHLLSYVVLTQLSAWTKSTVSRVPVASA